MGTIVQRTQELARILAIPRRPAYVEDAAASRFALDVSAGLSTWTGRQTLRPVQAFALYELFAARGLFGSIAVGKGKTLITLLAATVLGAKRPLIILPAALIDKTIREERILAQHWRISHARRFVSYEMLGRSQSANLLSNLPGTWQPDLIVADECHRFKSKDAACTKRVSRYMAECPDTIFVALSGTITKRSIRDYAHILGWCLPPISVPVPLKWGELNDWSGALDARKTDAPARVRPGALSLLCSEDELARTSDEVEQARSGFRRRLAETRGVVMTSDRYLGSSLRIESWEVKPNPDVGEALRTLRNTWTTPDGWPLSDPMRVRAHALEIALGFYYVWDPRPPKPWLEARKAWSQMARHILANNQRRLDSEKMVVQAIDQGHYPAATPILQAWRDVKGSFVPHVRPEWISTYALDACAHWMSEPGIVWTSHTAFGEALSQRTGVPFYGAGGLDARGNSIEGDTPETIIASTHSNKTGRNLQRYNRSLVVCPPSNDVEAEQLLGRTHREWQEADEVTYQFLIQCREHLRSVEQALKDARYALDSTGQEQRLLYSDFLIDLEDYRSRKGPEWDGPTT